MVNSYMNSTVISTNTAIEPSSYSEHILSTAPNFNPAAISQSSVPAPQQGQTLIVPVSTPKSCLSDQHTFGYVTPSPTLQGLEASSYPSQRSFVTSPPLPLRPNEGSYPSRSLSTTLMGHSQAERDSMDKFNRPMWDTPTQLPSQYASYATYNNAYAPRSPALLTSPNMTLPNTIQPNPSITSGTESAWISETTPESAMPANSSDQPSSDYAPTSDTFRDYSYSYPSQYDTWGSRE